MKRYLHQHRFPSLKQLGSALLLAGVIGVAAFYTTRDTSAAPGPITGSVFHDINGNGTKDAGEGAFSNLAIVNVYNSSGAYVRSHTSDNNGNFNLTGYNAGTYYISVYNITRGGGLTGPPGLIDNTSVYVEQTYGSVGAGAGNGSGPICHGAAPSYTSQPSTYTSWTVGAQNGTTAGTCFGGRKPDMTSSVLGSTLTAYTPNNTYLNGNAALNTQKSVSKVVLTDDSGVSNVDFGLSANVVTNTSASGQGSLSQFITNANTITGPNTMRFVPAMATNQGSGASAWWQINQGTSVLPPITGDSTVLDGRAWSNIDGVTQLNTNTGTLGGTNVGTTNYTITPYQKPELEVVGDVQAGGGVALIRVSANAATLANLGLNSTANYPSSASYFIRQTGGTNMTVNDNVMGVNLASGNNYSTRPQSAVQTAFGITLNSNGLYQHNYLSSHDSRGISLSNATATILGNWIIEQNSGPSAGVILSGSTNRTTIRHNSMPTAWLDAGTLLNLSGGLHTLTENTISGGSGVVLFGSAQNTITRNVITNATSNNPGVAVGNLSTGNYISRNSFSGNGGNAIDLNSDGVSDTTLVGCLTVNPLSLVSLANTGIARPVISNARLQNNTLTVDINYCAAGVFDVELYKATPGAGDNNAGEGSTYLGTFSSISLLGGTLANQTMAVTGVSPGDSLTAIVIDTVLGNTSEFGPNTTVISPPAAPTTAPDMTAATDTGVSNSDNVTANTTPAFTGICTNGQTVTLYIDTAAIAPTQVCSNNTYTITPSTPIASGTHTITSTFTSSGGESAASPGLSFTIDVTAPPQLDVPDMTAASDTGVSNSDNVTAQSQPFFTGSCETGDTITLRIDSQNRGVQTCVNGSYLIQPTTPLLNGTRLVAVQAADIAGNINTLSSSLTVTIDTVAPAAPVISTPVANSYSNTSLPLISGSGETGATLSVTDSNGASVCQATVSGGVWSCQPSSPLAEGILSIQATQTDIAGNISPSSSTTPFTIDTVAPAAPAIVAPANNSATNNNTPTVSGTAAADAAVQLQISGQAMVTVTADGNGQWSYTPTVALADGLYTVSATQTDRAGNISPSTGTTNFRIDTLRPSVTVNKKAGQPDPTTNNLIAFTVVFSEPIDASSFAAADITIGSSPVTSAPYVNSLTQINQTTWEVVITGMPNHTTVSASLGANTIQDAAGNGNLASTSTANSVLYEVNAPNITPLITNDRTPQLDGECIAGHGLELTIDGATDYMYSTTCANTNLWNFTVPASLADGTYNVIVRDTTVGTLTNQLANQTGALIIDTVRPSVSIDRASDQASPTNIDSARFIVTFSEPINIDSFAASDLTITGTSGTATLSQLNTTTWQATLTGMASGDIVSLGMSANRVEDIAGNGNTASPTTSNSVRYDNTPPNAPIISSPSNNAIINTSSPAIQGSGEIGATLSLFIDGERIVCTEGSPVIITSNPWTCTPPSGLAEGDHSIHATVTDAAGNTSPVSATTTITIDTIAPAAPSAPRLTSATDSGRSQTDGITNNTSLEFTGDCISDTRTRLYEATTLIGEADCANDTYTISPTRSISEGNYTITATSTDRAGNISSLSDDSIIVVDQTAPAAPIITVPAQAQIYATSAITVEGRGEDDALIALTTNNTAESCSQAVIVNTNGDWNCSIGRSLSDGEYTLRSTQTDRAGNESTQSTPRTFTIDTTPPATPDAPTLLSSSDSGSSNVDGITNITSPSFGGVCVNDTRITLYINSSPVTSVMCSGSSYQLTSPAPLSEGSYTVGVSAQDAVGNESSLSQTITVLIDSTPPASLQAPQMSSTSDSGISSSDQITNNPAPHYTGNCTTSDTITLFANGASVGQGTCASDGTYDIVPSAPLTDGTYSITVTATDIAGNQSAPSPSLSTIIDTIAPDSPVISTPADGTITNQPTQTIRGSAPDTARVNILIDGVTATCNEGTIAAQNMQWTCTLAQALGEGDHVIQATASDDAGNISIPSLAHTITIDTVAPTRPSAPTLAAASDTGSSNSDGITADTTPTFNGSCTNGERITLFINNIEQVSILCASGLYTITSNLLTDGIYDATVTATDQAGNISTPSVATTVTIVTAAPTPAIPELAQASDTGRSASDNITSDTTPTFTNGCTNTTVVSLYIDGVLEDTSNCSSGSYTLTASSPLTEGEHNVTVTQTDIAGNQSSHSPTLLITIDSIAPNAPLITSPSEGSITNSTQLTVQGSGEDMALVSVLVDESAIDCDQSPRIVTSSMWECSAVTPLEEGTFAISAALTDIAGNTSQPSSTRTITIDTTPPATPNAPDMTPATDSGVSNSDNITNVPQPVFTGGCTSTDTVSLFINNSLHSTATCSAGSYSLSPSTPLGDGTYNASVRLTDAAGNTSTDSSPLSFTILTVLPIAPDAPQLASISDSGRSNTDRITNVSTPFITGSCSADSTLSLYVNDLLVSEANCATGSYTAQITTPLDSGVHSIAVRSTDIAGNSSPRSTALLITIDVTAPSTPVFTQPLNASTTSNNKPLFQGNGEEQAQLAIQIDGQSIVCSPVNPPVVVNGIWECTPTNALADGTRSISLTQTDLAGNTSAPATLTLTINTAPPATLMAPDLTEASDTGASNSDNMTADTTPTFSGACQSGTYIRLYADATQIAEGECTNSAYSLTSTPLQNGSHTITATATNASGFTSNSSPGLAIIIDTTIPAPPGAPSMMAASDTGHSSSDAITNNNQPAFTGACLAGTTLQLHNDSSPVAQGTCENAAYELVPMNAMGDASSSITVVAMSQTGMTSNPSPSLPVTIDTIAPSAPTIAVPNNNAQTNNTKPTMSGTGETQAHLQPYINNTPIECAQSSPLAVTGGVWTCTPSIALADGQKTVRTQQTDMAGNTSSMSPATTMTIDTVAPARAARPDLTAATDSGVSNTDNITNVTLPNLVGSCTTGDTVRLRINTVTTSQMVCANNTYSLYPATALSDGMYSFSTIFVDPAGNVSPGSIALNVTIKTSAAKPSIPDLHVDSDTGLSSTDNITSVSRPTISGICNKDETVGMYINGILQDTVPCFPPFYAQPITNLSAGNHTVTMTIVDIAGNQSVMSDPLTITIDTTAPGNPTVTTPAAGTTPTITTSSLTTAGSTEPGAQIVVWENGIQRCAAISDNNGLWTCTLTNLSNGTHTYIFSAYDVAGNAGPRMVSRTINVNRP